MAIEINDERPLVKVNPRDANKVVIQEVNTQVKVTGFGPQGATGPAGAVGPQGPKGTYTVSETAPASPNVGDTWFNSTTSQMYIRYDGYWVETSTSYAGLNGNDGQGFTYQGTYSSSTTYNYYDVVTYNGSSYICMANNVYANQPDISQFWAVIAQKGATGATGPAGATLSPTEVSYTVGGGTTGGTQPTFNGAPMFYASYVKVGKLVHFRVNVLFTNITNFGTGQYYVTLPFSAKYDHYMRDGQVDDNSQNKKYSISGHTAAGSNVVLLYSTSSSGNEVPFTSSVPFNLATADDFHISGTYIEAD